MQKYVVRRRKLQPFLWMLVCLAVAYGCGYIVLDMYYGWGEFRDWPMILLFVYLIFGGICLLAALVFVKDILTFTPLISADMHGVTVPSRSGGKVLVPWSEVKDITVGFSAKQYYVFIQKLNEGDSPSDRSRVDVIDLRLHLVSKQDHLIQPLGYSNKEIVEIAQKLLEMSINYRGVRW